MQKKMKIAVRADSSSLIGSGHIFRTRVLARAIKEHYEKIGIQAEITYICRDHPGNLISMLEAEFKVIRLPVHPNYKSDHIYENWLGCTEQVESEDLQKYLVNMYFDLFIFDHYGLSVKTEKNVRQWANKIFVFDDLNGRSHDCDWLLDSSPNRPTNSTYKLPPTCQSLFGVTYAPLEEKYLEKRKLIMSKTPSEFIQIGVYFGMADMGRVTVRICKLVKALIEKKSNLYFKVICSKQSPDFLEIAKLAEQLPDSIELLTHVESMPDFLASINFAIGAGGVNQWERAVLGVPSLTVSVAENQIENCIFFASAQATKYIGAANSISEKDLFLEIFEFVSNTEAAKKMSSNALSLVDGEGLRHIIESLNLVV